jgi:hypothetical protein
MNIVMSDEYDVAPKFILRMRHAAGLSQRQVAAGLERSQGHVQRMETRQRSIEIVEFCRIAKMSGHDPVEALRALIAEWDAANDREAAPPLARQAQAR